MSSAKTPAPLLFNAFNISSGSFFSFSCVLFTRGNIRLNLYWVQGKNKGLGLGFNCLIGNRMEDRKPAKKTAHDLCNGSLKRTEFVL